jgi:hypothetical protein
MQPEHYMSFLVRLWRNQADGEQSEDWQGEIQQIQTGTQRCFSTLGELLAFLRQAVIAQPPASDEPLT